MDEVHMGVSAFCRTLIVWLCLWLTATASARELLAVGTSFPGVFEQQADGQLGGLAVSVLRETLTPLGHHVRFALYPWVRAQKMVESGQADILIGPYKSAEREKRFVFSARPFYRDSIVFFRMRSRALQWNGESQQMLGWRIGVIRGWTYGEQFDSQREKLDLVTLDRVENGLKMLKAGRLDVLASNERNTRPVMAALGLTGTVTQLAPQIDRVDGYFAFSKHNGMDELRKDMDREFALMVEHGRLAALGVDWRVEVP
jgi:polar amino acid transport system substrate-binding protein